MVARGPAGTSHNRAAGGLGGAEKTQRVLRNSQNKDMKSAFAYSWMKKKNLILTI